MGSKGAACFQGPLFIPLFLNHSVLPSTYDHIHKTIRDPVRSPLDKLVSARLVVSSVTTSESLVLYV